MDWYLDTDKFKDTGCYKCLAIFNPVYGEMGRRLHIEIRRSKAKRRAKRKQRKIDKEWNKRTILLYP